MKQLLKKKKNQKRPSKIYNKLLIQIKILKFIIKIKMIVNTKIKKIRMKKLFKATLILLIKVLNKFLNRIK